MGDRLVAYATAPLPLSSPVEGEEIGGTGSIQQQFGSYFPCWLSARG
jgi:hypothetical protein